jgi:NAD(P)-dependent dehydrogenase (short-subunit alcohol dehydrogenase family)
MAVPSPGELLDFSGKVVVVTGAGQGIGAGIAGRFGEAGAAVVVNYRSSEEGAKAVVERIKGLGRKAVAMKADVSGADGVEELLGATVKAFGRVDVLVNNAGTYPLASVLEMTEQEWAAVIDSNLRSVFLGTQARQHRVHRSGEPGTEPQPLQRRQGWGGDAHAGSGAGVGTARHSCERSLTRAHLAGRTG